MLTRLEARRYRCLENVTVALPQGLGFESDADMAEDGDFQKNWPQGQGKPDAPKGLFEKLLRKKRIPRSSSIYKKITSCVSARACRDSALLELKKTLKVWFPPTNGRKEAGR
ncbi:MAG: hypothetical protein LBD04_08625 [Synergistaceae bacterium]|jgi:hypothetical protein|nr:hypothetical protein [Synergistaceae bacterium]